MPFLHWERSLACWHSAKLIQHAQEINTTTSKPSLKDVKALECSAEEKLLLCNTVKGSSSHKRRTLDQYHFPTLDTSTRDTDQTAQRYARKHSGPQWQSQRMLMVDQLWLWVLDDHTVLTCFPPVWRQATKDPSDVCEAILRYLGDYEKRRWIRNVEELAYCIVDRCASNVLDSALMPDQSFDFLEMYRRAIGDIMNQQSLHFEKLLVPMEPTGDEDTNPFQATAEFRLLDEAKDIFDELHVIQDITKVQARVLQALGDTSRGYQKTDSTSTKSTIDKVQAKRIAYFLAERPAAFHSVVDDLVEKAAIAGRAVLEILDLKQKQANIFEARSATKMARESEKSNETIMLFTIITIIFLPLSTIISIFGMSAREIDGIRIGIAFAYICKFTRRNKPSLCGG
ncbi:uncharacterized protein HMPREF1541_00117 [Cyphellophora europaea CBS 101466]|uniref:Uncharacterized protein n=1 Tax=Cyphellophora europaea (strain CBS 101466) TaxID=1220924 RepID=W2SBG1_CYPE1|nr:uncharacterized protein HMPREF1541_00117 [Cyphellophora europaea CBS 101466]ETN45935.1 hypothetical protein HMPREF1541_00117 [Cyphellophora europaea CBS 101466]